MKLNLKPCKYCGGTGVIETQPFISMDYSYFRAFPDFIHGDTLYAVRCSCCGMGSAQLNCSGVLDFLIIVMVATWKLLLELLWSLEEAKKRRS